MATPATERQCFGEESLSRPLLPLSIRRSLGSRLRQLRFARYGGDATATRLLISTFPLLSVTNSALSTILAAQQELLRPPLYTAAQLPQTEIGRHKQKCVNDLSDLRR